MKVAILGAQGFLGKNVGLALKKLGYEITGFVLEPATATNLDFPCKSIYEMLSNPKLKSLEFDILLNFAAKRSTNERPLSREQVYKYTYEIPRDFILKLARPSTFVINISTYIQNYEGVKGVTVDSYGAAKQLLSEFIEVQSQKQRLHALDLYLFTLYGIGDRPNHLVPSLLSSAKTGKPIDLSPGYQLLDLMYVDDAVSNILSGFSLRRDEHFQSYSLWNENYFTIRELVSRIESTIGREIACNWSARSYAGHEMFVPWQMPIKKFPLLVTPTTLEDGIMKVWNSYVDNF